MIHFVVEELSRDEKDHHLMAPIHQFIKTQNLEDTSVVAMETQKKRGKVDIHFREMPETEDDRR